MALVHRVGWDPRFVERSPWLWPYARAAARLEGLSDFPELAELDALYAELTSGLDPAEPLRFVPNVRKRDRRAGGRIVLDLLYDARIARHREVPTRLHDWHDLFNALCFATFPRAKLALHRRQLAALERRVDEHSTRLPPARTREQDTLTLFDEGGVAIVASPEAAARLRAGDPASLPEQLAQLEDAGQARTVPFGHALAEHLVEGLTCPGGGTRLLVIEPLPTSPEALLDAVDAHLSALLHDASAFCSPAEHLHLRFGRMRAPAAS